MGTLVVYQPWVDRGVPWVDNGWPWVDLENPPGRGAHLGELCTPPYQLTGRQALWHRQTGQSHAAQTFQGTPHKKVVHHPCEPKYCAGGLGRRYQRLRLARSVEWQGALHVGTGNWVIFGG